MSATKKMKGRRIAACAVCAKVKKLYGRNLCASCYGKERRANTLVDFPKLNRKLEEVLEDWDVLRQRGMSKRQASEHMGYKPYTLSRMIYRAEKERASANVVK